MSHKHPFEAFLETFIPNLAKLQRQGYKLLWILETTGSSDAADLKAEIDTEMKLLFHDKSAFDKLQAWDKDTTLTDPLLKRQLKMLLIEFKKNQMPEEIIRDISAKEAQLSLAYARFRPECNGQSLTENEIRDILKKENAPVKRKQVWEASKQIGAHLAPRILELVELRNKGAKSMGYPDFFQMQLELQEIDKKWLLDLFDHLAERSGPAYDTALEAIVAEQTVRFGTAKEELGPWAWSEPFCQEDPLDSAGLDALTNGSDFVEVSKDFFGKMGFDVNEILGRSDMYEREGKNQHAFCINVDRKKDVRTLNNIRPTVKWLETVLHELGHAVYELWYDEKLPWLLKEPPHIFTTEAMALICGRQAYRAASLKVLLPQAAASHEEMVQKAEEGLKRRQLIFSRWVLVMTAFESELYRDPSQDLNTLWWSLVKKFQKINPPKGREKEFDWAAKYHIGMAPAYYFSYLLGELLASALQKQLPHGGSFSSPDAGLFFKEKLFRPGSSLSWDKLVEHATGRPLSSDAWLEEFA